MTWLFELLGAVALLLWGLRLVGTGIMRSYGPKLKRLARDTEGQTFTPFLCGLLVAVALQSSTATAMIVAGFSGQGVMSTATAFLTVLGADVGTAIAVLVASQKAVVLSPMFVAIGVFGFLLSEASKWRGIFRAILGLGLILLALSLISTAASSLTAHEEFTQILNILSSTPIPLLLTGILLTYLSHSSLAIVLLTAGFVSVGSMPVEPALYIILGANIGSGLIPFIAKLNSRQGARIVTTANLFIKTLGAAMLALWVPDLLAEYGDRLTQSAIPVAMHLSLNIGLAIIGMLIAQPLVTLFALLLPEDKETSAFAGPRYLDNSHLNSPTQALACAKREAIAMAEITQTMVIQSLAILRDDTADGHAHISSLDDQVDRLYDAIKFYIANILQQPLSEQDARKAMNLLSFTANMEHIGDIVDRDLMMLSAKKIDLHSQFSEQGLLEITNLHQAVIENFELAINTFVSEESELARQLYEAKTNIRILEQKSVQTHMERISTGLVQSITTSNLHLDVIRDLKRINSYLTAIAYPIMLAAGDVPHTQWSRHHERGYGI